MPRSASNRTNSMSSQRRAPSPAPSPVPTIIHAPSPSPSMVDTMKQGFSFGVGSAIANNLFRTNNNQETPKKNDPINEPINEPKLSNDKIYELYNKCLEKNDNNIDCTTIATFNYEHTTTPIYCSRHKLDNMIDIRSRMCLTPLCNTSPFETL